MIDTGQGLHRWTNRPLERESDPRHAIRLWVLSLWLTAALLPAGALLWHQGRCVQLTYRVNELREERDSLLEEQRRLRADLATETSLDRIERWAQRDARLVRPGDDGIVVMRPSSPRPESLLALAPRPADRE